MICTADETCRRYGSQVTVSRYARERKSGEELSAEELRQIFPDMLQLPPVPMKLLLKKKKGGKGAKKKK